MDTKKQETPPSRLKSLPFIRDFKDRYGELLDDIKRIISYLTEWALSPGWMRTYYGSTRDYSNTLQKKYNLTDEEFARCMEAGFNAVMKEKGQEGKVSRTVFYQILLRALMAASVSFVCELPPVNMQWFAVMILATLFDIIFFQRQVFLIIQELEVLYVGRDKKDREFGRLQKDCDKLQEGGGQLLVWAGRLLKWGLGVVARIFRKSIRSIIIQAFRIIGIKVSAGLVDSTTWFFITYGVSSLIAGIASYALFVWIAWHERNKLLCFIGHGVTPASDRCV